MAGVPTVATADFSVSDLIRGAAELSLGLELANVAPRTAETTPIFSGLLMVDEVQPGLMATGHDIVYARDDAFEVVSEPALICGTLLAGEPDEMEIIGHRTIRQSAEQTVLVGFREPVHCRRRWRAGQHSRMSGFMLWPSFFERFGADVSDDGLGVLQDFLRADCRTADLPRTPRIVEAARQNLAHPYSGPLARLFLESNTLAYVVEVASLLREERRLIRDLGRRHYDQVVEARRILDASLVDPPRTLELARRVGVNVTTLQANFRAAYATTIFGYVRSRRLEMARLLLRDYGVSSAEAGYRVGFSSPAAFTAAYRRHFGNPPGRETGRKQP